MSRRELHAQLRVTEAHDWVARDGRFWVFVLTLVLIGDRRLVVPVLVREGDE